MHTRYENSQLIFFLLWIFLLTRWKVQNQITTLKCLTQRTVTHAATVNHREVEVRANQDKVTLQDRVDMVDKCQQTSNLLIITNLQTFKFSFKIIVRFHNLYQEGQRIERRKS